MDIQLSDDVIRFTVSDAHDATETWHYDGTAGADEFSATVPAENGALLCAGTRLTFRDEDSVSGHFSQERRTLTGEEIEVYRLSSGEALSFRFEWSAARIE